MNNKSKEPYVLAESEKIKRLIEKNYVVVVSNPDAQTFDRKYNAYQKVGFNNLKRVIINQQGGVVALQG